MTKNIVWTLVASGTVLGLSFLGQRILQSGWRMALDEEPPDDPGADELDWRRAVVWTAASAAVVAATRLAARRGAAAGWERVTGSPPPAA